MSMEVMISHEMNINTLLTIHINETCFNIRVYHVTIQACIEICEDL